VFLLLLLHPFSSDPFGHLFLPSFVRCIAIFATRKEKNSSHRIALLFFLDNFVAFEKSSVKKKKNPFFVFFFRREKGGGGGHDK